MKYELDDLIDYISRRFVFDVINYPELESATDQQIKLFAIKHSALHFSKIVGRLAAECEVIDHGTEINLAALRQSTSKSLMNTL